MNHQMIEIEHLPSPGVMPVFFGIIAKIFVGHDDVMPVLLVFGQFVEGGPSIALQCINKASIRTIKDYFCAHFFHHAGIRHQEVYLQLILQK